MFDFEFDHITEYKETESFGEGVYLWIFHADKIPPHIGVSQNGLFYSLKSSGVDLGLETQKVLNLIMRKRIPSFIVEVDVSAVKDAIRPIFAKYHQAEAGKTTCLTPVKELFESSTAQKLSELLTELDSEHKILKVIRLNGDLSLIGIRSYGPERITERLLALQKQVL